MSSALACNPLIPNPTARPPPPLEQRNLRLTVAQKPFERKPLGPNKPSGFVFRGGGGVRIGVSGVRGGVALKVGEMPRPS